MTSSRQNMEIEKIKTLPYITITYREQQAHLLNTESGKVIGDKLNELVDVINNLHRRLDEYEK